MVIWSIEAHIVVERQDKPPYFSGIYMLDCVRLSPLLSKALQIMQQVFTVFHVMCSPGNEELKVEQGLNLVLSNSKLCALNHNVTLIFSMQELVTVGRATAYHVSTVCQVFLYIESHNHFGSGTYLLKLSLRSQVTVSSWLVVGRTRSVWLPSLYFFLGTILFPFLSNVVSLVISVWHLDHSNL